MEIDTVQRPATDLKFDLVPVIFANGEDEDIPGLVAAIRDERVVFDDRTYQPGEDILIEHRPLYSRKKLYIFGPGDTPDQECINDPEWVCVFSDGKGRRLTLEHCHLRFGEVRFAPRS